MSSDTNHPMSPTGEVFDTVKRFHIYDHEHKQWVMSGAQFEEKCIVNHQFEPSEMTEFSNPDVIVEGNPDLTLVWEDGEEAEFEEAYIDMDVAGDAAEDVISHLADQLDVDEERVRISSIEAPNRVLYYLTPKPL